MSMPRENVHFLVAMLVGFAVGCAVIQIASWQPLAVMQPSVDMSVQYQPSLASQSKFMRPTQPMRGRASGVVAHAESKAETGRRQMMAGVFGLAAAGGHRAAFAEDAKFDKVFGKGDVEKELPKAEDFTNYKTVQTKAGFAPTATKEADVGGVEAQPLLVPAVVAGTAVVVAGVPALLSPGQEAKDAQDKRRR